MKSESKMMKKAQLRILITLTILMSLMTFCLGDYYHRECGNPPSTKYREFAQEIGKCQAYKQHITFKFDKNFLCLSKGWTWTKLLAFIKSTKPDEYEALLAETKSYIHCVTLSSL